MHHIARTFCQENETGTEKDLRSATLTHSVYIFNILRGLKVKYVEKLPYIAKFK